MALPSEYTKSSILIVDDEEANVLLLRRILERAGYTSLTTTTDSRNVMRLVEQTTPDIVLLDLLMPHIDGYEVMAQLAATLPEGSYLPIMVLTADVTPQALERALSSGARDFLTKPFDRTELLLRVRNLLESRYLYRVVQQQMGHVEEINQHLQRLMTLREESVATMSHDLGQPLAAVRLTTEVLQEIAAGSNGQLGDALVEDLNRIDAASSQMVAMIAELSDMGRLQLGRELVLQRVPCSLAALVTEQAALAQKTSRKHHIIANACVELNGVWDRSRVSRVLANLLNNAIKFSPQGGDIVVTLQREADEAVVTLTDAGVGIPAPELAHVFAPYFRASNVAGQIAGSGIGLASVKKIVEQHGGSVSLSSRMGEGTTVSFRLPLTPD